MKIPATLATLLLASSFTQVATAQIDARMLRHPDVSATQIVFVYAGDVWLAPKEGGTAQRLSSPNGEETWPKFSPDGATIAFTGNYDGNEDIYTIPTTGGVPTRVTHHPAADRLVEWHPSGESLLYATRMTSGKSRFNQLYTVAKSGGLPKKLPMAYGDFASYSPDGERLAFMPWEREFRTWKRYRGGMTPDIWLFDLEDFSSTKLTNNESNDSLPMWHDDRIYFLSDRDEAVRGNIWAFNITDQRTYPITTFEDFDVRFPSIGPNEIVFENGGQLYLLDLATEEHRPIDITVLSDQSTLKPYTKNVGRAVQSGHISPTGKRAVLAARGDIFTLPAEHGVVRNITRSSGVAERHPAWSPDGKSVVYFSDRSGEYALMRRDATGKGEEETLVELGPGYRYTPQFSPDGESIVFIDQSMTIRLFNLESKELAVVDQGLWMYHSELTSFTVSWSDDSRWLTYSRGLENRKHAIFVYDTESGERRQLTSAFYSDSSPRFDPEGDYLFFFTRRTFDPIYSDPENTWIYANSTQIAAMTLRKDVPSPLAPRNDDEDAEGEDDADEDEDLEDQGPEEEGDQEEGDQDAEEEETDSEESGDDAEEEEETSLEIDFDGIESRVIILPPKPGNYSDLEAVKGKVLYRRTSRTGVDGGSTPIVYYDLEDREEKTVLGDADGFALSHNGRKLLVQDGKTFAIIDVKPGQKMKDKLNTGAMETIVDPKAEWKQIFADAWRLQRDYFYDANMHGVDWEAMRTQYGALLDSAVTRWDVNFVIGELIGELNAGHTYRSGGDLSRGPSRKTGLLGADFILESGAYRIDHIVRGAPWDSDFQSPLAQPGIEVSEGDYLLAVNGLPVDASKDPWAAFQGLANETVQLTVNDSPDLEGARDIFVKTLSSEYRLRNRAWVEDMRRKVDEATGGRVGYIYVPSTGRDGQNELARMFYGQMQKEALIIDERFNSGGQIPDRFIELLNRPIYNYWGVRDGQDWQWPPIAHAGPKVMLINGWAGSGGDAFPYYFREAGIGPIIGTRTWGGLIGITGVPGLIDGGSVTVPTFGIYNNDGEWIIESYGVDPDIEVPEDPTALAKGGDTQLERAIQEALDLLESQPHKRPEKPAYPDRSGARTPLNAGAS